MSLSFQALYASTTTLSETRRHYASSKSVRLYNVVPYAVQKSTLFQFEHHGLTSNGVYQCNCFWSGLSVVTEEQPNTTHFAINYRGVKLWATKPTMSRNNVLVRCTCPDFYFTFAWWNMESGTLFGPRPRAYVSKRSGRAPRNPKRSPGMCKHIFSSAKGLAEAGVLVP